VVLADLAPVGVAGMPGAGRGGDSRGRHAQTLKPGPGWVPTVERFRDPSSGVIMGAWIDPSDESRGAGRARCAAVRCSRRLPATMRESTAPAAERPRSASRGSLASRQVRRSPDEGHSHRRVWAGSACGTGAGPPLVARGTPTRRTPPPSCTSACARSAGTWTGSGTGPDVGAAPASPASRSAPDWSYPGRAGAGSVPAAGPARAGLPARRRYIRRTGRWVRRVEPSDADFYPASIVGFGGL
jgi:hypothetical protein